MKELEQMSLTHKLHEHDDWADGDCTTCLHLDEIAITSDKTHSRWTDSSGFVGNSA